MYVSATICLLPLISLISLTAARAAACIVHDLDVIREQILRLQFSLDTFNLNEESFCLHRDLKALAGIYTLSAELDSLLLDLVEDMQSTNALSTADSIKVFNEFTTIEPPLMTLLTTFENKCDGFQGTLGPFLTHRIIAGNVKNNRCRMMQTMKCLACRMEDPYKEIMRALALQFDSQFQSVISAY